MRRKKRQARRGSVTMTRTIKPNNLAFVTSKRGAKVLLSQKTDPVVMENIQRILAKTGGNPFGDTKRGRKQG